MVVENELEIVRSRSWAGGLLKEGAAAGDDAVAVGN